MRYGAFSIHTSDKLRFGKSSKSHQSVRRRTATDLASDQPAGEQSEYRGQGPADPGIRRHELS